MGAIRQLGAFLLPFATFEVEAKMAHKSVKLSEELLELAIGDAESSMRSTPMQIEYYYRLARLAEQYDDLPISMVKSLMTSTKEKADLPFTFSS
ncbi:MAG: hypothetical protein EBW15_07570 [Actinobacteria bacterium]|nr:hypothetical protein [Actinomycetota bacterium]NCW94632.1 hypothetical protein [Actinomycetota bacterium]NCX36087.1 hypothetical protein [Actinomycetota bacterium]